MNIEAGQVRRKDRSQAPGQRPWAPSTGEHCHRQAVASKSCSHVAGNDTAVARFDARRRPGPLGTITSRDSSTSAPADVARYIVCEFLEAKPCFASTLEVPCRRLRSCLSLAALRAWGGYQPGVHRDLKPERLILRQSGANRLRQNHHSAFELAHLDAGPAG